MISFSWHLCPDQTGVAEFYRAICWLRHTVQICRPCVWSGCFSEKLRTYVSQLSAAECQLFHSPPYSRCTHYLTASSADDVFINPHEYTVALSIGRGGSIAINLSPSLMGAQRVFLVFISISGIHTIVLVWNSALYTPQQTQLSSLKPGFWANLTLKFFLLFLRFSLFGRNEGGKGEERKRHALEKAFWYFVMC